MSTNVIETQELSVYYGQHRGIIDVDLQVHEGEVFGFLGPNGAGKTTTLRVLKTPLPPSNRNHIKTSNMWLLTGAQLMEPKIF